MPTPAPTADAEIQGRGYTFSFYAVATTADAVESETLLYSAVTGDLQVTNRNSKDSDGRSVLERLYLLFPDLLLPLLTRGCRCIDSVGNAYVVKFIDRYESHTEVYMQREGL